MRTFSAFRFLSAFLLASALLLSFPAAPAHAQDVQVPFDGTDGRVNVIDADLRARLDLFPRVEGFEEARLFRTPGGGFELALQYREGGRLLRERRALSPDDARTLRRRVRRALAADAGRADAGRADSMRGPRATLEDGRYRFLAATTLIGLIDTPLIVAAATVDDADDLDNIAAAALLGGTAGFFVPLLLTRGDGTVVTEAEATLAGYGGLQGLGHGALLSVLVGGEDNLDARATVGAMGALSVAEAVAGFQLARRTDMRGGVAEALAIGGLFGTSIGGSAALLAFGDSDDDGETIDRVLAASALAGSALGAYGGHRLGYNASYTQGDARIFGTAGLVGAQIAQAAIIAGDYNDETRAGAGTYLAGALGGLALGHRLVRGRDFGEAQGNIAALGAFAGGLAGGAVGILVDAEEGGAAVLSALGSLGGFLGTYLTYRGEAQPSSREGSFRLDVGVAPSAGLPGSGTDGPMGAFTPALDVRLSF